MAEEHDEKHSKDVQQTRIGWNAETRKKKEKKKTKNTKNKNKRQKQTNKKTEKYSEIFTIQY